MSDTDRAVRPQKMAIDLKLRSKEEDGLYYLCSGNKGADQLICVFVFAYAKGRFSHDAAHIGNVAHLYHVHQFQLLSFDPRHEKIQLYGYV